MDRGESENPQFHCGKPPAFLSTHSPPAGPAGGLKLWHDENLNNITVISPAPLSGKKYTPDNHVGVIVNVNPVLDPVPCPKITLGASIGGNTVCTENCSVQHDVKFETDQSSLYPDDENLFSITTLSLKQQRTPSGGGLKTLLDHRSTATSLTSNQILLHESGIWYVYNKVDAIPQSMDNSENQHDVSPAPSSGDTNSVPPGDDCKRNNRCPGCKMKHFKGQLTCDNQHAHEMSQRSTQVDNKGTLRTLPSLTCNKNSEGHVSHHAASDTSNSKTFLDGHLCPPTRKPGN